MTPYAPGILERIWDGLHHLPPGVILIIGGGLLMIGLWQGYRTLPLYRAVRRMREATEDVNPVQEATAVPPESPYRALLRMKSRFWLRAGVAYLCVLLGVWTIKSSVESHGSGSAFLQALQQNPFGAGDGRGTVSVP